ncbi:cobalt-precorrin-5B (C(1))-methyltransferase [Lusitaniella coriacea LEGE 07157]|uniref:Cobalt-precorrin-5B C(1)-methyltransferase n=1 Tax=Lusitaniella coriacea LEGE 07157 TaxID=945747 RepID=A0A8J7DZM5_9CYAN|nr:cobalt-precorrin-5B (C(1))-methyltransferase CbiD [Lusitaniella coriacea]MBE9118599.1 cobalt-precorrin-5B (C(1))-methyltransferase [Lusitaniella coriacea LEGE 07157]
MQPRSGYTLPVFACAAAIAALKFLQHKHPITTVSLDLIEPPQTVEIPIEQVAKLEENKALAIARSDPGDNLDITRNTPIWALVERTHNPEQIEIRGGEGIGRQTNRTGQAAIYRYAQQLLQTNLERELQPNESIAVTIILPEGKKLAERTSNAAFGVVEGLSLLGTTGIAQPLSAPGQLEAYREELIEKAAQFKDLVFCIGENGLDLARGWGISEAQLVKTANWLGPLFVTAGEAGVESILLVGYHGKLIKLAGGIFHTHHHLADGRLDILTAHCANLGVSGEMIREVFACSTAEAALQILRQCDAFLVTKVYRAIAKTIDRRTQTYIRKHSQRNVQVGSILFGRDREIIVKSTHGSTLFSKLCYHTLNN